MREITLSVVLTVYNMEECLEEFLDSLVVQSWEDYEVICVNDGSTDSSLDILKRYAGKFPRFVLVDQENAGASAARNTGMHIACGKYMMLLDSDDLLEPMLLQSMVEAAELTDADVVTCRSDEFHHRTGIWHKTLWATQTDLLPKKKSFSPVEAGGNLFRAFAGWPWDKLYRSSHIKENDLLFPPLRNSEDLCFVYAALATASKISVVDDVLIHHRTCRTGSVSNSQPTSPRDFYDAICILKEGLRGRSDYATFEHGFLNWAMDFSLWNIEGLPEGSVRQEIVSNLVNGGLPELELDSHPDDYFSLYPRTVFRLAALKKESLGGPISTRRSLGSLVFTIWNYVRTLDIVATAKYFLGGRRRNG